MSVVGHYPDVSEPEWEAERQRLRRAGAAFQADGARAATARYIQAARREVLSSGDQTRRTRQQRKRQEREGVSHAGVAKTASNREAPNWVPVADLDDNGWLKWLN